MNAKMVGCGEVTLVLSHGFGGSHEVWEKVLPNLSKRYRVMVFDWNFSGASVDRLASVPFDTSKYSSLAAFSDDLIALIDTMKLKGVVFVGHSMAGMIGCIASIKRPDLFTRLILVGASPRYLDDDDEYKGGFERMEVEKILSTIELNFTGWAKMFPTSGMGPNADPIATEGYTRGFQRMNPEVTLSVAKTVFFSDERSILEKVKVPCTIIQGTNDIAVPVSVASYMKRKVKGETTVEIFESEGHFPQLTAPARFVEAIDRALMPKKW